MHRFYHCSTILITAREIFESVILYLSLFASFACALRSFSLTAVWVAIDDECIVHGWLLLVRGVVDRVGRVHVSSKARALSRCKPSASNRDPVHLSLRVRQQSCRAHFEYNRAIAAYARLLASEKYSHIRRGQMISRQGQCFVNKSPCVLNRRLVVTKHV